MNLQEVIDHLGLEILTNKDNDFSSIEPKSGYISDLLSCVMAGANPQSIWVTLQAHINIVAVGALKDCCGDHHHRRRCPRGSNHSEG